MKHLIYSLIGRYFPQLTVYIKKFKKQRTRKKLINDQRKGCAIQQSDIVRDLKKMNVREGDSLLVHSSLSKIGFVNGGAETVVNALLEALNPGGTLLMPSFPADTFHKEYLRRSPLFDIRNTPSNSGAISECFRKMKEVQRSFHPTDPVCAFGPLADYFTSGHFGQLTPYNKFSPFYKLCEKKGKILMLGVTLDNAGTNLHLLEDAVEDFKFPVYDEQVFDVKMVDENGKTCSMKTKVHNPEYSLKRKCDELIPLFEKEEVLQKGTVGKALSMLIDATGMLKVMLKYYKEKGVTMYTPHGS